jgi:hypothetical protein
LAFERPVAGHTGTPEDDCVTMPDEDNAGSDRKATPLGSEVAPPGDPASQGGEPGPASGIAGPSYPPAETEPDARHDTD